MAPRGYPTFVGLEAAKEPQHHPSPFPLRAGGGGRALNTAQEPFPIGRHAISLPDQLGASRVCVPWGTNLDDVGLASVDRNNKATLPRTAPSRAIKSSAKDLSLRIVKLPYDGEDLGLFRPRPQCRPSAIQGQRPIRIRLRCAGVEIIPFQHGF
jgi:hypothetical protein